MLGCTVSALAGPAEAHARLALGLAELRPYLIPDRSQPPSLAADCTLSLQQRPDPAAADAGDQADEAAAGGGTARGGQRHRVRHVLFTGRRCGYSWSPPPSPPASCCSSVSRPRESQTCHFIQQPSQPSHQNYFRQNIPKSG